MRKYPTCNLETVVDNNRILGHIGSQVTPRYTSTDGQDPLPDERRTALVVLAVENSPFKFLYPFDDWNAGLREHTRCNHNEREYLSDLLSLIPPRHSVESFLIPCHLLDSGHFAVKLDMREKVELSGIFFQIVKNMLAEGESRYIFCERESDKLSSIFGNICAESIPYSPCYWVPYPP